MHPGAFTGHELHSSTILQSLRQAETLVFSKEVGAFTPPTIKKPEIVIEYQGRVAIIAIIAKMRSITMVDCCKHQEAQPQALRKESVRSC